MSPWGSQTGQRSCLPSLGQTAISLGSRLMLYAVRDRPSFYLNSMRGISSGSQSQDYNEQVIFEPTQCPSVCLRCPPAVPGFLEQLGSLFLMTFVRLDSTMACSCRQKSQHELLLVRESACSAQWVGPIWIVYPIPQKTGVNLGEIALLWQLRIPHPPHTHTHTPQRLFPPACSGSPFPTPTPPANLYHWHLN